MAPTRSKKRKSTESTESTESTNSSAEISNFPAPPQMIPTKSQSPVRTPTHRSPAKRARTGITMGQKQALMDNLQLESKNSPVLSSAKTRSRILIVDSHGKSQEIESTVYVTSSRTTNAYRDSRQPDTNGIENSKDG